MTVFGFSPLFPGSAKKWLKLADAEIYHSCEPSLTTYLAFKAMPDRKHMVTFRDPRDFSDWKMEYDLPSLSKLQVLHNYLYENNRFVRKTIPKMHAVYTIGKYLIPKVRSMYGLSIDPQFLPTPVEIPPDVKKADVPTVCYAARLDRRKRPELFLDLARKFPEVRFIAMGKSRDLKWDRHLREKYAGIPNLEMTGFVDQFGSKMHSGILEKSWIMVNTATREALPNAFLEAAAHRCAILSTVNPDNFSSEFGYYAKDGDLESGLKDLLDRQTWKQKGERAFRYILEAFELTKAIDRHVREYNRVLGN